ncbi:hypothetical protein LWI29_006286 [Acer saccharum]|uniref:RNase H type-1 domain-containing protein n=1 Tax=Acer saccharum TaxID=4024 RepID=A0AA39TP84_ACESA|nr:hypothetical protein LWI29_006286 [Acer saccharum]
MCWSRWENLCKPKAVGGLGFRDLSLFNRSLLAKQAWRVLKSPNSLITKIFKSKYFNHTDFLHASAKIGCSHVWRSIMWGKKLLLEGLRWRVGNGTGIKVFSDPWIPRPSSFKPISSNIDSDLRVSDLIDAERHCWDIQKLDSIFLPIDKEVILSIPISVRGGDDCLSWHYDKNGIFTVKSGYWLALNLSIKNQPSPSSISQKWWKGLWHLDIPPKIKMFIWRVCSNALPNLYNLWIRKVVDDPVCFRCRNHAETVSHALFWCPASRKVWRCSAFSNIISAFKKFSGFDTLIGLFCWLDKADFSLVCVISWSIWNDRNEALHGGFVKPAEHIVSNAGDLLLEYQNTGKALHINPKDAVTAHKTWLAPPPGLLKLNTDVSFREGSDLMGIGAAIRNSSGKVVAAVSKPFLGKFSVELGELIALREGLLLAKRHDVDANIVELDSVNAIAAINSDKIHLGDAMFIISDIQALCREVGVQYCKASPRDTNRFAHMLANLPFSSGEELQWRDTDPQCIFPVF